MIHILGRRRRRRRDNHWESSTCCKRRQPRHSAWIVAQHQKLFEAAIDNCDDNAMRLPSSYAQRLSDFTVLGFVPVVRSAAGPFILARRGAHCVRHCTPRTCLGKGLHTLPLPLASGAASAAASSSSSSSAMALTCLSANQTQPPSRRTSNSNQQLSIFNCQSREICLLVWLCIIRRNRSA